MYLPIQYAVAVFGLIMLESATLFVYTVIGLMKSTSMPFIIPGQSYSSCQYGGAPDLSNPDAAQGLQQFAPPGPFAPIIHTVSVTATTILTTTINAQSMQTFQTVTIPQTLEIIQTSETVQTTQTADTTQTSEISQTSTTGQSSQTETSAQPTQTADEDNGSSPGLLSALRGHIASSTARSSDATSENGSSSTTQTDTSSDASVTPSTVLSTVISKTTTGTFVPIDPTTVLITRTTMVAPTP